MRGAMIAGRLGVDRSLQLDHVRLWRVHRVRGSSYVGCARSGEPSGKEFPGALFQQASAPNERLSWRESFSSRENGQLFATPLFLVLLVVEITDVTFAVDSIPAVFGITRDPFIVYTSNVFAILGLRAFISCWRECSTSLHILKIGLALVLIFVGVKMIAEPWLHISVGVSLAIVLGMLVLSVLASLGEEESVEDCSCPRLTSAKSGLHANRHERK